MRGRQWVGMSKQMFFLFKQPILTSMLSGPTREPQHDAKMCYQKPLITLCLITGSKEKSNATHSLTSLLISPHP
jgi:hypothetical protein